MWCVAYIWFDFLFRSCYMLWHEWAWHEKNRKKMTMSSMARTKEKVRKTQKLFGNTTFQYLLCYVERRICGRDLSTNWFDSFNIIYAAESMGRSTLHTIRERDGSFPLTLSSIIIGGICKMWPKNIGTLCSAEVQATHLHTDDAIEPIIALLCMRKWKCLWHLPWNFLYEREGRGVYFVRHEHHKGAEEWDKNLLICIWNELNVSVHGYITHYHTCFERNQRRHRYSSIELVLRRM